MDWSALVGGLIGAGIPGVLAYLGLRRGRQSADADMEGMSLVSEGEVQAIGTEIGNRLAVIGKKVRMVINPVGISSAGACTARSGICRATALDVAHAKCQARVRWPTSHLPIRASRRPRLAGCGPVERGGAQADKPSRRAS